MFKCRQICIYEVLKSLQVSYIIYLFKKKKPKKKIKNRTKWTKQSKVWVYDRCAVKSFFAVTKDNFLILYHRNYSNLRIYIWKIINY